MPPLVPISGGSTSSQNLPKTPLSQRQMLEAVKGGSSLLKAQTPSTPVSSSSTPSTIAPAIPAAPTVDPLQEMMANEKQQNKPLPEPSSILPPSTFHEIINGPSVQKKETEGSTTDKDDKTAPSGGESENNKESDAEDNEKAKKVNPV